MPVKRIIVSVTNDLTGDQRVDRICRTLCEMGFAILLTGRILPDSGAVTHLTYDTHRFRLFFRKGPLFYVEFNLRLFFFLLFRKSHLLLANDLDTLPANRLAGWIKRQPVVYDSHEYFTEVPELAHRPRVKKTWEHLEKWLVPGVAAAYTVCQPIADHYTSRYGIPFRVVRNLPEEDRLSPEPAAPAVAFHPEENPEVPDKTTRPYVIYQGALNLGRGVEHAIRAMALLPEADLVIAGGGDLELPLRTLAASLGLTRVRFTGRLSPAELRPLTRRAALGCSIEEDLGLSYRYALPNKLFDYIQARIPVVVSNLPEMSRLVTSYDIGLVTPSHDPEQLAACFREALFNRDLREKWHLHLEAAARQLTWACDKPVIHEIFTPFL